MVLPYSDRVSRVPPYSRTYKLFTITGLSPCIAVLPNTFMFLLISHWPTPRSLATTYGISVDLFSSGYWDVSVLRVRFPHLCIQCGMTHKVPGFPIRKSSDQRLFAPPRRLSQRITSFIASRYQGIHRSLLSFLTIGSPHADFKQRFRHLLPSARLIIISSILNCFWLIFVSADVGQLKRPVEKRIYFTQILFNFQRALSQFPLGLLPVVPVDEVEYMHFSPKCQHSFFTFFHFF